MNKRYFLIALFVIFVVSLTSMVSAADLSLVNSKDWIDVYSVSLAAAFRDERTNYVTSESLLATSKTFTQDTQLKIFESSSRPYIPSISSQLTSASYSLTSTTESNNFNLDLDIRSGSYILISDANFRSSIAAASYAVRKNAWVLFVNENNVGDVVDRIQGSANVLALGQFPRSVKTAITPYVTRTINNDNIYTDTQELAKDFGITDTVTLADGANLEAEFFLTKNPVLLSGFNKILDDTYDFLVKENVKSVIIVGNQLSVVGEQIRSRSQKKISVFIKFAQSDTKNIGSIFALTFFPLPQPVLSINITKAVYDPQKKQVVAYFENLGNSGAYFLSTITLRQNSDEIGTLSAPKTIYIAAGEKLPVFLDYSINQQFLSQPIRAEFYTSFGVSPSELDSFLTLENKFGPPFSIPLEIEAVNFEDLSLQITDGAYYSSLKRIGVTVLANSTKPIFYTVKVNGLIVQGLKSDFAKSDSVGAGKTKTSYMSARLDDVDLEENTVIPVTITYGIAADQQFQTISASLPFRVESSNMTLYLIIAVIIVVLIIVVLLMRKKNAV